MTDVLGIDVSHHQATTPSLDGLAFLFVKASEGTTPDHMYGYHVAKARARGLVVGAYAFGRYDISTGAQMATFLEVAADADLLAIDVEGQFAPTHAMTEDLIRLAKQSGKPVGLYHSESGYFEAGQDFDWVANWSRKPGRHWDFWQYRGSPLDLDRFNGSLDDLHRLAWALPDTSTGEAMLPITDQTPLEVTVSEGRRWYDLDGVTVLDTTSKDLDWRPSPYGCGDFRAIYATVKDKRRIVLVHPTQSRPVQQDCANAIAAEHERTRAAAIAAVEAI